MVWIIIGKWVFSCYASWRLKRAQRKLDRIKLNNYRQSRGLPPIYSCCEKVTRWISNLFAPCTTWLKRSFCPCCIDSTKWDPRIRRTFYHKLWINGTKENYIAKCLAGFIVGILLFTMLWNAVHANPTTILNSLIEPELFQAQNEPSIIVKAAIIVAGVCSTCALTFSEAFRCILVLALLQFFTNKGRVALLAYTLVLALSGPSRNSVTNMEILTESLACGQDLLKESISDLFNFVSHPLKSFQVAISHVINALQGVFGRMRDELGIVVDALRDIVSVIRSGYTRLTSIVEMCNHEFGTPYDRCKNSFDAATESCKEKLGSALEWMCSPVDVFNFLCKFAKLTDAIVCWFPSIIKAHVFDPVVQQFRSFSDGFKTFFDARLNVTYKLDHELIRDKTVSQVLEGMKNDIFSRCEWIFQYISWMDLTLLLSLLVVLYKATTYRWKFLYSDRYDNFYLSSSLIQMDIRRNAVGGESIFPMRRREMNIYVETFSWRMVKEERKKRNYSVALVCMASTQILSYLVIDYALYKFMEWIRLNASIEYKKWNDPILGLTATVEGDGFLAAMYRSILENLNPVSFVLPSMNTSVCLPVANKPDYKTYFWIVFLLLMCFSLAMFEPYGLRIRHIICGWVYPTRVIERERWLYVHILTTRGSFIQFAKDKIRQKIGFVRKKGWKNRKGRNSKEFNVSCKERLIHKIPFLGNCFDPTTIKCFVCGSQGHHDDRENFIDCLHCNTIYCKECLEDMHDQCIICHTQMHSEPNSEIDEEMEFYDDHL